LPRHISWMKAAPPAALSAALCACGAFAASAPATPPDRGIELVTPADSGPYNTLPLVSRPDGNSFYWFSGLQGTTGDPGGEDGAMVDVYLAKRGSAGWETSLLTPGPTFNNVKGGFQPGMDVDGLVFATDANLTDDDTNVNDPLFGPFVDDLYRFVDGEVTLLDVDGSGHAPSNGIARNSIGSEVMMVWPTTPDLSATLFMTNDGLVADDTDGVRDVYLRRGDEVILVSRQTNGQANNAASETIIALTDVNLDNVADSVNPQQVGGFPASQGTSALSEDGTTAAFLTNAQLDPADTDNAFDLYVWRNGQVTLASNPAVGAPAGVNVTYEGMSANGEEIYFATTEALLASDPQPASRDIYRYRPSADPADRLELATGDGADHAYAASISRDGDLFFTTVGRIGDDPPAPGATPVLYRASGTSIRTVAVLAASDAATDRLNQFAGKTYGNMFTSPGSLVNQRGALRPLRVSDDGDTVAFVSDAQYDGDSDNQPDLYVWRAGSGIKLASAGGSGTYPAVIGGALKTDFNGFVPGLAGRGITSDGSRVYFTSAEKLTSDAPDNGRPKVYEWVDGTLTLISPDDPNAAPALYVDNSDDGRTVFFRTTDSLVNADDDGGMEDIYAARVGGGFPVHVSPIGGPPPTGGANPKPAPPAITSTTPAPEPPPPPTVVDLGPKEQGADRLTIRLGARSLTATRRAVRLRLSLSAPAVIRARLTGPGSDRVLARGRRQFRQAVDDGGLRLKLTKAGRKALADGRAHRLTLRLVGRPSDGGARTTATFRVRVTSEASR
jgi:hypothetical protein